jgi:hypothetical protein
MLVGESRLLLKLVDRHAVDQPCVAGLHHYRIYASKGYVQGQKVLTLNASSRFDARSSPGASQRRYTKSQSAFGHDQFTLCLHNVGDVGNVHTPDLGYKPLAFM